MPELLSLLAVQEQAVLTASGAGATGGGGLLTAGGGLLRIDEGANAEPCSSLRSPKAGPARRPSTRKITTACIASG